MIRLPRASRLEDSAKPLDDRHAGDVHHVLKSVGEVAANDISSADAVIVGAPVYCANVSGEIKTFFDDWSMKFDLFKDRNNGSL